jgi:branched-chain amino acid transport system permease protein
VEYFADVVNQILILMILAVSLNVLLGYAGQVSMATAAFYAIGSYATGILIATSAYHNGVWSIALSWDFIPAAAVAIVFAFISALVISLPAAKRVTGEFLILLTLAFQIVVQALVNNLDQFTGGPNGLVLPPLTLLGIQVSQPTKFFWIILGLALLTLFVARTLGESPFGRVLKGVREDELAVQSVGKPTVGPKMIAFGVTAALCGMAGAFAGPYFQFVAPGTYSFDLAIFVVAVVTLGGPGNLLGTVLASIVLGGLKPLLQNLDFVGDANSIAVQSIIYGLALVVLMRVRPEGFLPEGVGIRSLLRHRNGNRRPGPARATGPSSEPAPAQAPVLDAQAVGPTGDGRDPDHTVVLRIEGLDKRFGGLTAVSKVNLTLRRGRIAALIGPNGAGKTTIFNLITGVLRPDAGRVTLNGVDLAGRSTVAIAELGMARSFQNVRLFQQISALDNVALAVPGQVGEHLWQLVLRPRKARFGERETRRKAMAYLEYVGIADRADERVSNLSFAEQKLVAIARLLATEADVLLLDEPTSGIDPMAVDRIIDRIRGLRDLGKTICIVEHSLHVVERLADHVFFMDEGNVVAEGTVSEITSQPRLVEVYFGT